MAEEGRGVFRAIRFAEYGGTDKLTVVEVPSLAPGPGQVRLRVKTAGVNPVDAAILSGSMQHMMPRELPAGLGSDVAGIVIEVGPDVTGFAVGDEVLGSAATPSFAEEVVAEASAILHKPAALPWPVAGALTGAATTASEALGRLGLQAGQTLLIHAAAGGVGSAAVQLAVADGVRVLGTASASNADYLRSLGAEPVLYGDGLEARVRALAPQGVDAVLDASGRGEIPLSIALTGAPERVLSIIAFDQAATGIRLLQGTPGGRTAALRDLLTRIEAGSFTLSIWRSYRFTEVAAALDAIAAGHLAGKIVIDIG